MGLIIEVGKTYRDGYGRPVHIHTDRNAVNIGNPFIYRFIGDQGQSYASDGSCRVRKKDYSLVSEWTSR